MTYALLSRVDAVIIGPGLSRDLYMQTFAQEVGEKALEWGLPVVLDGDGINFLVEWYKHWGHLPKRNLVITPNHRELKRLCELFKVPNSDLAELSKKLNGAVIVAKDIDDTVTDGKRVENATTGSSSCPKRCGGQGDILAGCIGAYLAWNKKSSTPIDRVDICIAACRQVRWAAAACYSVKKRSMLASDMLEYIGEEYE